MAEETPEKITPDILEEISGTEFNDRITSLPIFQCEKCSNLLKPPIILVKYTGNVCGTCRIDYDSSLCTNNQALETVLQNLIIPCKNHQRGCKEKLNYADIPKHELICNYRVYICPLKLLQNCAWEGSLLSLHDHFTQSPSHVEFIQWKTGSYFRLDIDISKNAEMIKLLYDNHNNKFILHTKCNLPELRLQLVMYHIKDELSVSEFLYTVRMENCGNANDKLSNKVYQDKDFNGDFNTVRALNIDLSFVKQFVYEVKSTVSTCIEITSKGNSQEEVDEKSLSIFECPVCNNYMKPPIYQCLYGHSICNSCKLKLKQCPTCRANFGNTRNYALEEFSNDIRFPCVYRDQGCNVILPGSEIVKHEHACSVQLYQCPFSNACIWRGSHSEIIDHVKIHEMNVTEENNHLMYLNTNVKTVAFCMRVNDRIFRVCIDLGRDIKNACWSVQLIGPKDDAKMFKYEIGLIDSKDVDKKLVRTEICQEFTNNDVSRFEQCIKIPFEVIAQFSNGNRFASYCKIVKITDSNQKKTLLTWLSEQNQLQSDNAPTPMEPTPMEPTPMEAAPSYPPHYPSYSHGGPPPRAPFPRGPLPAPYYPTPSSEFHRPQPPPPHWQPPRQPPPSPYYQYPYSNYR